MDKKEKDLEILQMEYQRTYDEIKLLVGTNDKNMGLGVTILTGLSIVLPEQRLASFAFLFPILVFALFFYGAYTYKNIMIMGGYKRCLEERINTLAGSELLVWESKILNALRKRGLSNRLTWVSFALLLGWVCYFSIKNTLDYYGFWVTAVLSFGIILFLILLIIQLRNAMKEFEKTYLLAKASI